VYLQLRPLRLHTATGRAKQALTKNGGSPFREFGIRANVLKNGHRRLPIISGCLLLEEGAPFDESHSIPMSPVDNTTKVTQGSEYRAFTDALRKILRVSHSEMMDRLAADKKAKASKPRPSVSRDSGDKGWPDKG